MTCAEKNSARHNPESSIVIMTMDQADHMEGPSRNSLLGIAQIIMLGELAVNRALDNIDPQAAAD
jgi:hypothetical protein